MFEGTFKYFFILFIFYMIVYITVRVCIADLLKRAKDKPYKAYIPFYTIYYLVKMLDLKKSVFYMTLIPFVNLYYYNIIIKKLLEAFGQDSRESALYLIIPLYKFPELIFKNPKYITDEYTLTEGFLVDQNIMFNKESKSDDSVSLSTPTSQDFNQISEIPNEINNNENSWGNNDNTTQQTNTYNQVNEIQTPNDFNHIEEVNTSMIPNQGSQQIISSNNLVEEKPESSFNTGVNDMVLNQANNTLSQANMYNQINNIQPVNEFNNIEEISHPMMSNQNNEQNILSNVSTYNSAEKKPAVNFNQSLFNSRNTEVSADENFEKERNITHETYVEAAPKVEEKEKPAIVPFEEGRPKVCPNCGAKLAPTATTCFLCGHSL